MIQVLLNDNSMLTTEEDYGVNKQTEKDDRTLENAKSVQMKLIFLQSSSIGKLSWSYSYKFTDKYTYLQYIFDIQT